uniref:Xylulose kinase-1 n=1 Tax=Tanacetum cinerariifolium TaxID=118510 RepID=A0A6L2P1Z7_TANCI|nr:hypothetical protein [Tanacetum cinerariifolium]
MATPIFAKTHNLIAYLAKPADSEGFEQIIDFLNRSSVRYVLTASLTIRTSCIKQFWSTVKVKTVNDEVRVQALIDGNKVTIKESSIRRTLRLDDEECLSAKTTSLNELSSTMASTIICLATNQKFNFLRYILLSLVKNIKAGVPFYMFSRFVQLLIDHQLGDMSHHQDIYDNPSLTKKVFANMKRVGIGFYRVITPLFKIMLVIATEEVGQAQDDVSIPTEPSASKPYKKHKSKKQQPKASKVPSPEPSPAHQLPSPTNDPILDADKDSLTLQDLMDLCTRLSNKVMDLEKEENRPLKEKSFKTTQVDTATPVENIEKSFKQGRRIEDMDEDVAVYLEEAQAKAYNLDLQHAKKVLSMQDIDEEEPAEVEEVLEVVKATKLFRMVVTIAEPTTTTTAAQVPKASSLRRRRGVIIQDPEETATSLLIVYTEVKPKDKGKGILIEEPKPLKRQAQFKADEAFERQYQALKRKHLTEAQAKKNMMIYLKNMAGFKMDFFKGMTYSEIRPILEKHYNSIQAFLKKEEEVTVQEEGNKRQANDDDDDDDDDDVYTEATPLASKNFDKEDLETLWKLVKERYGLAKQMLDNVRLEVEEESKMSLELLREFLDPKKKLEIESWLKDGKIVDPLVSLDDVEYFDTFPTLEEFRSYEWLLKYPKLSSVKAKIKPKT